MNIRYFTTPEGDEMAILPRAELEALSEAAEHAGAMTDYLAGRLPGLTPDDARAFVAANSPLAFWRGKRGLTQSALAAEIGEAPTWGRHRRVDHHLRMGDVERAGHQAAPRLNWVSSLTIVSTLRMMAGSTGSPS
jgi:hypothetical protein